MAISVEREVKLPVSSWLEGEVLLASARLREKRCLEINSLFDFPDGTLRDRSQALRIRRARGSAWLTFKESARISGHVKHRNEYETTVADPDAVERTLQAIGLREQFRYEKYRQVYVLGDLEASLDETPIGFFIELEGPAESIQAAVESWGLTMNQAVVLSYPELYQEHRRQFPAAPRFMIFPDRESSR